MNYTGGMFYKVVALYPEDRREQKIVEGLRGLFEFLGTQSETPLQVIITSYRVEKVDEIVMDEW